MRWFGPRYAALARFSLARTRGVAAIALLLAVVSSLIALPPKVDGNLTNLLPADDPAAQALRALYEENGGSSFVVLSFEDADEQRLEEQLHALVPVLEALPTVRFALHELEPQLALHLGLLQLDTDELTDIVGRVNTALAMGPALNPLVAGTVLGPVQEVLDDPSGLPSVLQKVGGLGHVIVIPAGSNSDPDFCEQLFEELEATVATQVSGSRFVWMAGAPVNIGRSMFNVRRDVLRTSAVSVVLVVVVLALAFRSWRATLLVLPPLVLANLVNLALISLMMGRLNSYTSMGTAVLVGLGIDFGVHLVGRYREERAAGREPAAAVERAWALTGPPCGTAAMTSMVGFLALLSGDFRGLSQLGLVLATGVICCLAAMVLLLPPLLVRLDPEPPAARIGAEGRSSLRGSPVLLAGVVLATVGIGAARLPALEFEYDISAHREASFVYSKLSERDQALMRQAYPPVVLTYDSAEAASASHARFEGLVESGELKRIGQVLSIDTVLPPDQVDKQAALTRLAGLSTHPQRDRLPLPIAKALRSLEGWQPLPLAVDDLPPALARLLGSSEGKHRVLLMATGNLFDMRESAALLDDLTRLSDVPPAGEFLAQGAMYRTILRDMPRAGGLALLGVTLLAFLDLRRFAHGSAAILSLLAGMTWAGVAIQAFGVKLTLMNLVGIPILLGIGVDVVIHLTHRLRAEGPGGVGVSLRTTGVAAMVSTLTTVVAFSSLTQATNNGVRSVGTLVVIGLSAVFLVGASTLSLLWAVGWRVADREEGSGDG